MAAKKDGFAKVVVDLEARLKELESRLEESELRIVMVMEASRELEEELLLYKKEVMEHHEKGFQKVAR